MKKPLLFGLFLLSLNAFADEQLQSQTQPAPAQSESAPQRESYAGALLGEAIGTSSGSTNTLVYAGRVGTAIFADRSGQFSLGLVVAHDSVTKSVGTVTASGNDTYILAEILARKAFGTG